MRNGRRLAAGVTLGLLILLTTGCSSGSDTTATTATTDADKGPRVTLVTLGSTETSGDRMTDPLRNAWAQRLYRASFPRRAVYVNLGTSRTTVARARAEQLPQALALRPTIATVWFGVSDAFDATPVDRYTEDLKVIVDGLRGVGARVLVVLGPGPSDGDVDLTVYSDAATSVAEHAGAELVDLRGLDVRSDAAQQEIADAIGEKLGPIS